MTAKVIRIDAFRPCTCCGGRGGPVSQGGAHSRVCPKRMTPAESWEAWECKNGIPPCDTLEKHVEHVNHLIRSHEKARAARAKARPNLNNLIDKLNKP